MQFAPVTRKMGAMGRPGMVAALAAGALALAGCGSTVPIEADPVPTTTPGPASSGATSDGAASADGLSSGPRDGPPTTSGPLPEPTFPVTVRRTGGAGDFDDTVVLLASGTVQVDTRSVHGRTCTLPAAVRSELFTGLRTIILPTSGRAGTAGTEEQSGTTAGTEAPSDGFVGDPGKDSPDTSGDAADRILISVIDVHDRRVDLTDPSLGELSGLVDALVQDVTLSSPVHAACTSPQQANRAGARSEVGGIPER